MKRINKLIQCLFLVVLVITLLIILKGFLIPFSYGLLTALIVYPICKKFENRKVPRSIAIIFSLLLVVITFAIIIFIFALQVRVINKEIPELSVRVVQFLSEIQKWVNANFGISIIEQGTLLTNLGKDIFSNISEIISTSFSIAAETIFNIVIIPVYAFLILFYRELLINFVQSLIGDKYKTDLPSILLETIHMYFNYIKGMFFVYVIVGILNSVGLLILGVDYAILFGMVAAFMTIIPYFGILISSILPIAFAWVETNNILYPLGVIAVFSIVQYLEANIIFPYIVGKQLGVNALLSLVSMFIGAVIWGVSGMILFLPFVALLKIISGHIEGLKPLYKLLDMPQKRL